MRNVETDAEAEQNENWYKDYDYDLADGKIIRTSDRLYDGRFNLYSEDMII